MAETLTDEDVARMAAAVGQIPSTEVSVVTWSAKRHQKQGSPDSLRVSYSAGLMSYPEWILLQHSGPGRYRAEKWWRAHGGAEPVPACVGEAMDRWAEVTPPETLFIRANPGGWGDIVGRTGKMGSTLSPSAAVRHAAQPPSP